MPSGRPCALLLIAAFHVLPVVVAAPAREKDDEVDKAVRGLWQDDFSERQEASDRLLAMGLEEPGRVLAALPRKHEDPEIAETCLVLRRRILVEPLRRRASAAASSLVQIEIVRLCQNLGPEQFGNLIKLTRLSIAPPEPDAELAFAFAGFLEDPDPAFHGGALWGFGRVAGPEGAHRVAPFLKDPRPKFRRLALQALDAMEADGVLETALAFLTDEDREVRHRALDVVERRGGLAHADRIIGLLDHTDDDTKKQAIHALARLKDPTAVSRLGRILHQKWGYVLRINAASALGYLGDPAALPLLAAVLEDADVRVRCAAATAMGRLTGNDWIAHAARVPELIHEEGVLAARAWWQGHKTEFLKAPR